MQNLKSLKGQPASYPKAQSKSRTTPSACPRKIYPTSSWNSISSHPRTFRTPRTACFTHGNPREDARISKGYPTAMGPASPGGFPLCPVFILIVQGTTWLGSQKLGCSRAGLANILSHYLPFPWDTLWPHRDLGFPGLPVHQMLSPVLLAEFIRGGKSPNYDHPIHPPISSRRHPPPPSS